MTYGPVSAFPGTEELYTALFEALSSSSYLLRTDAPRYSILAATTQILKYSGLQKKDLIGKSFLEAFPSNPADPNDTGENNLQASLNFVLQNKMSHQLPVQRYDVADEHGSFVERYWRAENKPVLTPSGEVAYIVHTTEDITNQIKEVEMKEQLKGMKQAYNLFMQTPIPICILKGPELIIELTNEPTLQLWSRTKDVIGLPLEQAVPEVKGQGYIEMLNEVRETGIPNQVYERPVTLIRNGKEELAYINYVYEPYYEKEKSKAAGVLAIGNNVTDKVLARKQATETEQSLGLAAEIAELGVFNIDIKTTVITYSKQVIKWFEFEKPSVHLRELFAKIHTDDRLMMAETIERSIAGEWDGRHDLVYRVLHTKTGVLRYLRSIGQVLFESGVAVRISGILQDMTEQITSRRLLEESEERSRNLIYSSPFAIGILKGVDHVITIGNDAIIQIWGKGKEIIGKSYFEVLPELAEQGYREVFNGVYTSGKAANFVETPVHILQDGIMTLKYYNFILYPQRNDNGEVDGIGIIASEVTPLAEQNKKIKESESRFQNLIREATVGIVVLTGDEMKVAIVNDAYGKLIGYTAEKLMDKNMFDVIPDAEAYFRPLLDDVRLTGKPLFLYDTPYSDERTVEILKATSTLSINRTVKLTARVLA
ncbi:MAG: hypothetical protein NVS9B7_09740 [Flavisolibacter sp.]